MFRKIVGALGLVAMMFASVPASAQFGIPSLCVTVTGPCSSEATALLSKIQQIQQTAEQVTMRIQQIQMVKDNATNLTKLPNNVWDDFVAEFKRLQSLMTQTKDLAVSAAQIDLDWKATYRGYQPTTDFYKDYKTLSDKTTVAIKKALSSANMSIDDIATLPSTIETLKNASQTSVGALQAIQAGNAIAISLADQMSRMRILMRTQMEMQQKYLQQQQEQADMRESNNQRFYRVDPKRAKDDQDAVRRAP